VPPDPEVPTFTWLYDNIFHGYCSDRNQPCHNPGANRGVSFSTRDRALASLQDYLVPGDAFASDVYYFISDGMMPPFDPRVPADLQAMLAALDRRRRAEQLRGTCAETPIPPLSRFAGRGDQSFAGRGDRIR
jgi:hypothetical protein